MERSKFAEIIDGVYDLIGHQGALLIDLAAVEDPVSYCDDLAHVVYDLSLAGGHLFNDLEEGFLVSREIHLLLDPGASGDAVGDESARTDTLAVALSDHLLVIHLDQLIFEAAGTGIYD